MLTKNNEVRDKLQYTKQCCICGYEGKSGMGGLIRHLKLNHNLTPQEYYDSYLKTETDGKCLICDKDTDFTNKFNSTYKTNMLFGYRPFCSPACRSSASGKIGGKEAHIKHPDLAIRMREKALESTPDLCSRGGKKAAPLLHKWMEENKELSSKISSQTMKATHLKYPIMASETMIKWNANLDPQLKSLYSSWGGQTTQLLHPNLSSENGKKTMNLYKNHIFEGLKNYHLNNPEARSIHGKIQISKIHAFKRDHESLHPAEYHLWIQEGFKNLNPIKQDARYQSNQYKKSLGYILDFTIPHCKVCIEIDGSWHDLNKDAIRDETLQKRGWTVLRFKNEEVFNNTDIVVSEISQIVKKLEQGE